MKHCKFTRINTSTQFWSQAEPQRTIQRLSRVALCPLLLTLLPLNFLFKRSSSAASFFLSLEFRKHKIGAIYQQQSIA